MPPVGATTLLHRWQNPCGSSVYDNDISAVTTVSAYLTGNLGNDTITLVLLPKVHPFGGGLLFDTSTDGADSLTIAGNEC